jgi:PPOX class probable F420-dependent enzyme
LTSEEVAGGVRLAALTPLHRSSVALLTTYRRDGRAVITPVGIQAMGERVRFATWTTTGKVKRLARDPRVALAPCTRTGRATGPALEGVARRLEGVDEAEARAASQCSLSGRLWLLTYCLSGKVPVWYEVSPISSAPARP